MILVRNGAAVYRFGTAVADIRGMVDSGAMLFFKMLTDLIAFVAGSTLLVTDKQFFTDICPFASKTMNTKVVRIREASLIPEIRGSVKPYFFGDGRGILAEKSGNILEGDALIKRFLDIDTIL